MAFGDFATLIDSGAGPDEDPLLEGGNWQPFPIGHLGLQRLSNAITSQFTGGHNINFGNGSRMDKIYGPDIEVYATINVVGAGGLMSIGGRMAQPGGSGPFYDVLYSDVHTPHQWDIRKFLPNGSGGPVATTNQLLSNGDRIGLQIIGAQLTAYHDSGSGWTPVVSYADPTPTNVGPGLLILGFDNSQWACTNFFGGTIPPGYVSQVYRRIRLL